MSSRLAESDQFLILHLDEIGALAEHKYAHLLPGTIGANDDCPIEVPAIYHFWRALMELETGSSNKLLFALTGKTIATVALGKKLYAPNLSSPSQAEEILLPPLTPPYIRSILDNTRALNGSDTQTLSDFFKFTPSQQESFVQRLFQLSGGIPRMIKFGIEQAVVQRLQLSTDDVITSLSTMGRVADGMFAVSAFDLLPRS